MLNVDPITDESTLTELTGKVTALIDETYEVSGMKVYDITLTRNGEEVDPANPVTVSIPVPEEFGTELSVYHQKDDGSLETINSTVSEDGTYVNFLAEHFSPYLLVDLTEKAVDPTPEDPDEPGTTPEDPADPDEPGTTPDNPADPDEPGAGNGQNGTDTEAPSASEDSGSKAPDVGSEDQNQGGADQETAQSQGQAVQTGDGMSAMNAAGYLVFMMSAIVAFFAAIIAGKKLRK